MNDDQNYMYKQNDLLPEKVKKAVQTVNRNNPLPLYQQLLQALYSVLEEGELEPGSFFATEALLQEVTGMSRATIRKAIEELVRRGMLVRITGKGTFVALPDVQMVVPRLKSLTQELTERGMKPGTMLLEAKWTTPPENAKKELGGLDQALCIRRVRTGNGIPLLYLCAYVPPDCGLTPEMDFSGSLYELLSKHGKHVFTAIHTIKATIISSETARLLGVKVQSAGLKVQRTTFDQNEIPILYEEGVGRGDLYSYTLKMQHYSQM
jgi:GntR family transcriptional regulator